MKRPESERIDPAGRLDVLLLNLGAASFGWLDQRFFRGSGVISSLWSGPDGLRQVLEQKIDEVGIPREKLTPQLLAQHVGFIRSRRRVKGRAA